MKVTFKVEILPLICRYCYADLPDWLFHDICGVCYKEHRVEYEIAYSNEHPDEPVGNRSSASC